MIIYSVASCVFNVSLFSVQMKLSSETVSCGWRTRRSDTIRSRTEATWGTYPAQTGLKPTRRWEDHQTWSTWPPSSVGCFWASFLFDAVPAGPELSLWSPGAEGGCGLVTGPGCAIRIWRQRWDAAQVLIYPFKSQQLKHHWWPADGVIIKEKKTTFCVCCKILCEQLLQILMTLFCHSGKV